jgi:Flp pilus assembly protein TadG
MNARRSRRGARGQIIPMAAIMMIALLALVALAIDGGRGYLDRRTLQSTADTAALSGAGQLSVLGRAGNDLSYARAAAINEAVSNLPGTSLAPSSSYLFSMAGHPASPCSTYPLQCDISGLSLGNQYTMDVQATRLAVTATLHHTLPLTFGVAAGFGPSLTPSATATAENGALGFALILFRNNSTGSNSYGNLLNDGSKVTLDIRLASGALAGTTADAMTNESICPKGGTLDFGGSGAMYAYQVSGTNFPGSCGNSSNVTNANPTTPTLNQAPQIANPNYPEPVATSTCSATWPCGSDVVVNSDLCLAPGTYSSINVKSGRLVLAPSVSGQNVFKIDDSTGKDVGFNVGNGASVDMMTAADTGLCGHALPTDTGVAIEMVPNNGKGGGTSGDKNQLNVTSGGTFHVTGSRTNRNISIYVENSPTGDPCFWNALQGCGSSVVVFQAGAAYNVGGVVYGYGDNMTFGGGSGGAGIGQVFAWTVKINGNGNITETYDPSQRPWLQGLSN